MSWPQWPQQTGAVAGWTGTGMAPAAPQVGALQTPAVAALQTPGTTYTPDQWAAMQQQNWQQWVQWQQQYQQWQQQYGEQYQKSLLAGQATAAVPVAAVQPPLPVVDPKSAPPLPSDIRPPLPPEEPPRSTPASVTAPAVHFNVPPPNVPPPPAQQQGSQQIGPKQHGLQQGPQQYGLQQHGVQQQGPQQYGSQTYGMQQGSQQYGSQQYGSQQHGIQQSSQQYGVQQHGLQQRGPQQLGQQQRGPQLQGSHQIQNPSGDNYSQNRFSETSKPPPLLSLPISKPPFVDNQPPRNQSFRSDFSNKRAGEFNNDHFEDAKKNRWEALTPEKQEQKPWNSNQTPQRNQQPWSGNKPTPTHRANVEELSDAEKNFDKQFEQWEAQFNKWKEQNAGHPDKTQYKQYEAKWESWRAQLLERREQMRKKRLGIHGSPAQSTPTKSTTPIVTPPTGKITPGPVAAPVDPPQQIKTTPEPIVIKDSPKQPTPVPSTTINKPVEIIPENKDSINTSQNDISVLFSQPPKEQRTNIKQRRISIRSDTDSNADTSFLKANTSNEGGIPGLDLVKDGDNSKLPDNKEEKKPETDPKLPDFEALSKGINSILGDEKLLSMLSMVAQNKKVEQDSQNITPSSNNPTQDNNYQLNKSTDNQSFSNDQFGKNQHKSDYDQRTENQPNRDIQGRGPSNPDNFNDFRAPPNFNQPPPGNFSQAPPNRGPDNFNQSLPNRDNFNQGAPNRMSNEFNKFPPNRGDFERGPPGFESQNRSFDNFNQGPSNNFNRNLNNFNQGPPGRGSNFNRGPGDFNQRQQNRGPGGFNQSPLNKGPDDFNAGLQNRGGPGNFNRGSGGPPFKGPGGFNQGSQNRGPGDFNQGSLNRGPGDFNQGAPNRSPDDFSKRPPNRNSADFNRGTPNRGPDFNQSPLNRGLGDFTQRPPNRNSGDFIQHELEDPQEGVEGDLEQSPEDLEQDPENLEKGQAGPGPFNKGPSDFKQGPTNRGPDFNQGPGDFNQGNRGLNFNQCPPNRGSGDFNQGPPNRGPGNFNQGPSNRGPGDFNQEQSNRGPGNFSQPPPNRGPPNRGGPDNFNHGTLNRPPRGHEDFNQGPNRGPGDFNQRQPNRGPGDFNQGPPNRSPHDFKQGPANRGFGDFNKGPPNRTSGEFNQGPNKGPGNFDQGPPNRDSGDFNQGPNKDPNDFNQGSNRGSDNFNQGPPNRGLGDSNQGPNRGPNDFNQRSSRGPNDFNQGPNRGPGDFNQGAQNRGPGNFNQGPNRGPGNFNQGPPNRGPGDFNQGPRNRGPGDFNQGPPNRGPNDFNQGNRGPNNFNQGPNWGPQRHPNDFNTPQNRGPTGPGHDHQRPPPFNSGDGSQNKELINRPPSQDQLSTNRGPGGTEGQGNPIQSDEVIDLNEQPGLNREVFEQNSENFDNSRDFNRRWTGDKPPDSSRFPNPNVDSFRGEKFDKYWDEALILKPVTVVDYGHKSMNKIEPNFMEPVQTFDYGHTSKNVDKKSHVSEPHLPSRLQRFSDQGSKFNRDFPPKPSNNNRSMNREGNTMFNRKPFDNLRSQERFDKFSPKHSRFTNKSSEEYKDQYEDIDDFEEEEEEDPFEEPEFNRSSHDRELEPFVNKPNPSFDVDSRPPKVEEKPITVIEDLLVPPGRLVRPPRIVIILRGPPGSGKTFLAKLIKDKEVEQGGCAPRILSLDDYFMVEQDKDVFDKETGRKTIEKKMVYEYEECMELAYRQSLEKAFKKTITDGFFPFIILDCVNDKTKHFSDMWSFAKQNGFQVYVCQMELDTAACTKRNIHHRSGIEIERLVAGWETTPSHYLSIDATSLIQSGCISEVEMEEVMEIDDDENDDDNVEGHIISKWERMEPSGDKLARLDGISKPLRPRATMEDYLQLDDFIPDDKPGQKRVRWADLEERRRQDKIRAIGFVVGQTDWGRMMDPTQGGSALTQTKYIERVGRRF